MIDDYLKDAIAAAAEMDDQTKVVEGGQRPTYPKPGRHMARFVEYIEIGKQKRKPGQYGEKPPIDQIRLCFELVGPRAFTDVTVNGEPKKQGFPVRTTVNKSQSSKGDFLKVFNAMDAGAGHKHMAQMLGKAFLVTLTAIDANKKPMTGDEPDYQENVKYLNLYSGDIASKAWSFSPPLVQDPETGETKAVNVPQATLPLRCFLWNVPRIEAWNDIFISGEREVKTEDGQVTKRSKNIIQEMVMRAVNWEGSPMHVMLAKDGLLPEQLAKCATTAEDALGGDPLASMPGDVPVMDDLPF